MEIEITTHHWDESGRAVSGVIVGEVTSTEIKQLRAGEIGPEDLLAGFFAESDVVYWLATNFIRPYPGEPGPDPDNLVDHGYWVHTGVSIAA